MASVIRASDLVKQHTPKFNPVIAGGIVSHHFKGLENYINRIFHETAQHFPDCLKYTGYRRCTPKEEADHLITHLHKSRKHPVELAESSTYLIELGFEYNDGTTVHKMPHRIYLPYLSPGNQMWIRGVLNTFIPVLTAPVFSVEDHSQQIFMKFMSNKVTFQRTNHTLVVDGQETTMGVVWGLIHKVKHKKIQHWDEKKDESVVLKHALAMYMFYEYGLTQSFKKYVGCDIITYWMGSPEAEQIDRENYTVFSSRLRKPLSFKGTQAEYMQNEICIAVPKEYARDSMTVGLIAGFYYVADAYGGREFRTLEDLDEPMFWQYILGKVIYRTKDNYGKLITEMVKHRSSVMRLLDRQQAMDLKNEGIDCDDAIDLLAYIVKNFATIVHGDDKGSIYNKRLLTLRNIMEDFIIGFNNIQYKTQNGKTINKQTIAANINKFLPPDLILRITKRNAGFCRPILAPCDNMAIAHTNKFLMQNNLSENSKADNIKVDNVDHHLHPSVLEVGSYMAIKRSEVSGRALLNPYQQLQPNELTGTREEFKPMMDYLYHYIVRK